MPDLSQETPLCLRQKKSKVQKKKGKYRFNNGNPLVLYALR